MHFMTGYFAYPESGIQLVLQQVVRRRGNLSILFAYMGDEGAREWTEWFYEMVLPACRRRKKEICVDYVSELFAKELAYHPCEGDFCAFFAVGEECFYAWRGGGSIHLFNNCFQKFHDKTLTYLSDELQIKRASLEPGVEVLLGELSFFDGLEKAGLSRRLEAFHPHEEKQVQGRLRDICEEIQAEGGKKHSAIIIVARGEKHDG